MASQRKALILFITVLFLQSLYQIKSHSHSPSSIPPLVKELCDKTNKSTFCIKTLESDNRTSKAKNATDITKIFLSIGVDNAKGSRDYILGLLREKPKPKVKTGLVHCTNSYNATSFNFRSALIEVGLGEYQTANYDIMVCDDQVAFCETSLSNAKIHIPEISNRLNVTLSFISVGATFTSGF